MISLSDTCKLFLSVQHERQPAAHGQQHGCGILRGNLGRLCDAVTRRFDGIKCCTLVRRPVLQVEPRARNADLWQPRKQLGSSMLFVS